MDRRVLARSAGFLGAAGRDRAGETRCTARDCRRGGRNLRQAQRRNGFTVDDTAAPVAGGDQRGDRNSPAPTQQGG